MRPAYPHATSKAIQFDFMTFELTFQWTFPVLVLQDGRKLRLRLSLTRTLS